MGGACGMHGREEKCIQILIGKHEGKKALGSPRSRLENNSNIDLY
jgi:hypothetical protein